MPPVAESPAADALPPPNAPNITLVNERFMALHMAKVNNVPAEPTKIPPVNIGLLSYKKPPKAAAKPVNEFNNEITTGISAPPIGIVNNTP